MLDGIHDAHSGVGGIPRQQDHLDVLLVRTIQAQQLFHQHERRPGGEHLFLVLDLVAVISVDAGIGVDAMALRQVKQRAR